ncbi:MAG: asparagine synthetase B [Bacteroidetes bacterium]|nr:asparagine synthetase B [Bacteroidota bacterium]
MTTRFLSLLTGLILPALSSAQYLLVPMDDTQSNHLKAYGVAYWQLAQGQTVEWLLNYRGGSFLLADSPVSRQECLVREVSVEPLSVADAAAIKADISRDDVNSDVIRLEKAPKIAVYTPPNSLPWDDAVTLALTYAEIKYDKIWDREVLEGKLSDYDWLHLHHEDFTGQYGKFYQAFSTAPWYIRQQAEYEAFAREMGFRSVHEEKKAVAEKIREYVGAGGFMFAMCSATDTYDIALAARGIDIAAPEFDGTPAEAGAQERLDFTRTFAFQKFMISLNPLEYEYSSIDIQPEEVPQRLANQATDFFTLFQFSAKWDPVPTMLTQNHRKILKGFLGQTTLYKKQFVKSSVVVLGEYEGRDEVKYLTGNFGKGSFTFFGGHDPEDFQHAVGDPPTDLALHKNSPGYRLILNNVLFPAARKKPHKT